MSFEKWSFTFKGRSNNGKPDLCNIESITINYTDA